MKYLVEPEELDREDEARMIEEAAMAAEAHGADRETQLGAPAAEIEVLQQRPENGDMMVGQGDAGSAGTGLIGEPTEPTGN